jgi:hypothetical protein
MQGIGVRDRARYGGARASRERHISCAAVANLASWTSLSPSVAKLPRLMPSSEERDPPRGRLVSRLGCVLPPHVGNVRTQRGRQGGESPNVHIGNRDFQIVVMGSSRRATSAPAESRRHLTASVFAGHFRCFAVVWCSRTANNRHLSTPVENFTPPLTSGFAGSQESIGGFVERGYCGGSVATNVRVTTYGPWNEQGPRGCPPEP